MLNKDKDTKIEKRRTSQARYMARKRQRPEFKASHAEYMKDYAKTPRRRIYMRWRNMVIRCTDPESESYERYGGRGITVCEEWLNSFPAFLEWAQGSGFSNGLEIDRINNEGPYSPGNCHWVTRAANCRNRRSSKLDWGKVVQIRQLVESGMSGAKVARAFEISQPLVSAIARRKVWAKP